MQADFLKGLETGQPAQPDFRSGLRTQKVCDAVHGKDGVAAFTADKLHHWNWIPYLMGMGGRVFKDPPGNLTPVLNTPEAAKSAEWYANFLVKYGPSGLLSYTDDQAMRSQIAGRANIRTQAITWLLPLLLLRAFIPSGFMASWSADGLQLTMCSGTGPMPAQKRLPAVDASLHQDGSNADGHPGHSRAEGTMMCAFAAAGACAAMPSFDASTAFVATVSRVSDSLRTNDLPTADVLIDRIRGPPLA
ncbi:MAG: hypothetical protein HC872_08990 [Gammaproteobacteria bacterium]|nr:hypothetical protein [Gammaproteobacteria bacterium]